MIKKNLNMTITITCKCKVLVDFLLLCGLILTDISRLMLQIKSSLYSYNGVKQDVGYFQLDLCQTKMSALTVITASFQLILANAWTRCYLHATAWSSYMSTVNSFYCRYPWDRELVSLIARVRNNENLFQSNIIL